MRVWTRYLLKKNPASRLEQQGAILTINLHPETGMQRVE